MVYAGCVAFIRVFKIRGQAPLSPPKRHKHSVNREIDGKMFSMGGSANFAIFGPSSLIPSYGGNKGAIPPYASKRK
jgi:hypothetical protein